MATGFNVDIIREMIASSSTIIICTCTHVEHSEIATIVANALNTPSS